MASNAASSIQCSANGTETARAVEGSLGCDDRLIVGDIVIWSALGRRLPVDPFHTTVGTGPYTAVRVSYGRDSKNSWAWSRRDDPPARNKSRGGEEV